MSRDPREVKAQRWLSEQIEQLKALRTSNVRDTEFKQWRQSTLTIIQRIWTGESKRSARFRRIPFSPPSSQAPLREVREFYERGCAEAAQLLKALLDEVIEEGVPEVTEQARPASVDPGVAEDDFPTLDLPGGPPKPDRPRSKDEKPGAGRDDARPGAVSIRGERGGEGGPRRPGQERRRKQSKNGSRRRLRDMLGLDALEKLGKGVEQPPVERAPAREEKPVAAERADDETPEVTVDDRPGRAASPVDGIADDAGEAVASAGAGAIEPAEVAEAVEPAEATEVADPMEAAEAVEAAEATEPLEEAEPAEPTGPARAAAGEDEAPAGSDDGGEEGVPFTADEFLSASPIFKTEGKPVRRARRDEAPPEPIGGDFGPAPLTSSAAIAVAAIAAEVARLGVPDAQRARTRATLVNLAQRIEDGALDWEGLRAAVAFAMEYPPIGRRLLPLLIPFLDRAA